jgi:hypothetical protein
MGRGDPHRYSHLKIFKIGCTTLFTRRSFSEGGLTLAMVKERGSGRDCAKKSIDEHIVVSCSIEIVFTTVFSLLKDLVSDDALRHHHFRLIFLSLEAFGLLVLLSFDISAFTPAAYQRHRL